MNKSIIILLFLVILLCSKFFIRGSNNSFIRTFQNTITFIKRHELYNLLIANNDNYYNTFSTNDMKVRNINNIKEYFDKIKESVVDLPSENESIVIEYIDKIDKIFNNINYSYLDGKKFNNIPWKIGFVKGKLYENGFPHTRYDIIILPIDSIYNNNLLIQLLIHEKIHVYQKLYPEDINNYLLENNFVKYKLADKTRANPDINEWIYSKDNKLYYAKYNDNPQSIADVTFYPFNDSKYEHPYEEMACDLTNIIINNLS
jgi:hypothetical protein